MRKRDTTFRFPFDIDTRYFLLIAAFAFLFSIRPVYDFCFPKVTIENLKENISKDVEANIATFNRWMQDTTFIQQVFANQLEEKKFKEAKALPFGLFIYQHQELVFWNSVRCKSPLDSFQANTPLPYKDSTGYYVVFKKFVNDNDTSKACIALFKIKNDYGIQNHYFSKNFLVGDKENDFNLDLSFTALPKSEPIIILGKPQFYVYRNDDFLTVNDKSGWRLFFCALPFIFFGISIHTYFKVEIKKKNIQLIYGLLLATILLVRGSSLWFGFPNDYTEFGLFSPEFFASDFFNRSLGDLFINVCLLFWALLFYIINVQGKIYDLTKNKYRHVIASLVFLAGILLSFYLSYLVYRMIRDSVINFDTTQFYRLDLFSFIGLLSFMVIFVNILCLAIIMHHYIVVAFSNKYIKYVFVIIAYVAYKLIYDSVDNPVCFFYLFLCMMILFLMLDLNYLKIKFDFNSQKLLLWLMSISLAGAFFLTKLIVNKELLNRELYAQKVLQKSVQNSKNEIEDLASWIKSDSSLHEMLVSNQVRDEEINNYIYLNYWMSKKEDMLSVTRWYDSIYYPIELVNGLPNDTIFTISTKENIGYDCFLGFDALPPSILGLRIKITRPNDKNSNPYNDLILSTDEKDLLSSELYSIAVYTDSSLYFHKGKHAFPFRLQQESLHFDSNNYFFHDNGHWNEVWIQAEASPVHVAITKEKNDLYLFTTLFAYIFFIYFVTISLYILGNIIARSNLNYKRFLTLMSLNLRLRIQLSILIVELLSFIVIGYSTSYFLMNQVNDKNKQSIHQASYLIQDELNKNQLLDNLDMEMDNRAKDSACVQILQSLSSRFNIHVNLFQAENGKLLYSSLPDLYKKQLISNQLDPTIYKEVKHGLFDSQLAEEKLGSLSFISSYFLLRNTEGKQMGVVQIPFFLSTFEIRSENTGIITTLINIYIFVFLFSAIIAFFLTKSVTRPFSYIVKQFTKINLSKTNEPLKWFDSDEIGLLIKEYNRMLRKLENSTVLLAKTERELAWREMAKQVAHEIKNPLTPMKLSLQMLERAIKNNANNVNEIAIKVTKTLVEQIDNLSLIATDFSNFAKLPVSRKEVFALSEFLYSVTGMYHDDHNNEFLFIIPEYQVKIFADKSQIMRVFTNIIQNAIQSIPEEKKGNIALTVTKIKNNFVRISISDNGEGISAEKATKLFQPYFTTKTSGTGLGLAMCKDILEESGGRISFESDLGEGTVFHLDLPIYVEGIEDEEGNS
jgi:two-component system nitrogen regulation sensor histidine kinase NtrY